MTCTCPRVCSHCGDASGNHLHRPTIVGTDAGFDCKVCNKFTSAANYAVKA